MTTQHTPTPWHVDEQGRLISKLHIHGNWIANANGHGLKLDESRANQDFIEIAVNCHDDLLAACGWIMLMDDDGLLAGGPTTNRGLDAVRAAIAKAKPVDTPVDRTGAKPDENRT